MNPGFTRGLLLAWSPNLTPERAEPHGLRAVSEDELFAESDVITIHMPLSECYVTTDAYRTWFGQVVENIVAWRSGAPVRIL